MKLYLDSSVLGFSIKRSVQRRREANLLLQEIRDGYFIGGYSFVTEAEISAASPRIAAKLRRKVTWAGLRRVRLVSLARVYELAQSYCRERAIPEEYFDDALHVAVATHWRADALVSYNFAHLVRLETMVRVNRVNRERELPEMLICSPREVIR